MCSLISMLEVVVSIMYFVCEEFGVFKGKCNMLGVSCILKNNLGLALCVMSAVHRQFVLRISFM